MQLHALHQPYGVGIVVVSSVVAPMRSAPRTVIFLCAPSLYPPRPWTPLAPLPSFSSIVRLLHNFNTTAQTAVPHSPGVNTLVQACKLHVACFSRAQLAPGIQLPSHPDRPCGSRLSMQDKSPALAPLSLPCPASGRHPPPALSPIPHCACPRRRPTSPSSVL